MTKRLLFAGIGLMVFVSGAISIHSLNSGARLSVKLVTEKADIGIPGISKMYGAKLKNDGLLPVLVKRCDFVDDTLSPGKMVAYAVQRWDNKAGAWEIIIEDSNFCKPYPLGIVKAKLTSGWLLPGQSLETGLEATAARNAVRLGDRLRFVVFTGLPGDHGKALATESFEVDEAMTDTTTNYRVRH